MIMLETQRLRLRYFRKTDLDDLYFYAKEPEVGTNAGWAPHRSKRESKQWLDKFLYEEGTFAIVEKHTETVIGSVSYRIDGIRVSAPGYYEIGYALGKPWWGKGYMTEAVKALVDYLFLTKKAILLTIRRTTYNVRSGRIAEKNGFRYEGTLRHSAYSWNGKIEDMVYYSLTHSELLAHQEQEKLATLEAKPKRNV